MGWRVFYSYSHKDEELRKQLETFLGPLRQKKKITEWQDRKIEPGAVWDKEIKDELRAANLILFLISPEFLDSDYCFGVEVETALERMKRGEAKVIPILLRPCLWEESRFSALQLIPRDAKAVCSWTSLDEALRDVAKEVSKMVAEEPPKQVDQSVEYPEAHKFDSSLDLVRNQIRCYAHIYERTRQRMVPSDERTVRLEQIFSNMRSLAMASYPLVHELAASPSPGERLAAVSILQVFASESLLTFLVGLLKAESRFVGYHALKALRFAVNSLDPSSYPALSQAIGDAKSVLPGINNTKGRGRELAAAEQELNANMKALKCS
jgi:hypothetical protein